jgi:3-methyl-2-oxobutanoate hydroxymethyltransferase
MPFGSFEASPDQAFANAARVMAETGASAVKLECGRAMVPTVEFLAERGIPVMAHIGLTPQAVNTLGGYRARGRDPEEADRMVQTALALQSAGAFSILIEATVEPVSRKVAEALAVPTIGIGASADCDGQVLVTEDMLGLTGKRTPKFVRRYAELGDDPPFPGAGQYLSSVLTIERRRLSAHCRAFLWPHRALQPFPLP